jgi:Fe-S-cluster containining protein
LKDCNQCGKCCIKYGNGGIAASEEDIDMWAIFRPHIHQYVIKDKIWFNPETGTQLTQCPFLEKMPNQQPSEQVKYTCAIYLDRPEDCRQYPSNIAEMVRDECEMIEVVDLNHPKKAQLILDDLMSDSR